MDARPRRARGFYSRRHLRRRCFLLLFFFKQKTAYEIGQCLEFRRVLFRSDEYIHLFVARTGPRQEGSPEDGIELLRRPFGEMAAAAAAGRVRDAKTAVALLLAAARQSRSEERRVGKECRARRSQAQEKKKN